LVLAAGLMLRAPLSRVPENSLKFVVGSLLTGFGLFWTAEGVGAPFPGGDLAIPALIAAALVLGLALAGAARSVLARRPRWA
jgi:uncharacterized membrane protein